MIGLRRMADVNAEGSFSNRMRSKRFARFEALLNTLSRPVRILDVGGTNAFWEQRGYADQEDVQITLVNIAAEEPQHANITPRVGNATDMGEYGSGSFDVAFSNSVIEHLFTFEKQRAMAAEMQRVAPAYWVQTPNFWFPIEPHFLTPAWHWLPVSVRAALIRRCRFGWRGPCPDKADAHLAVEEVRLLTQHELTKLFPNGRILAERFSGLVKSWICIGGFPG